MPSTYLYSPFSFPPFRKKLSETSLAELYKSPHASVRFLIQLLYILRIHARVTRPPREFVYSHSYIYNSPCGHPEIPFFFFSIDRFTPSTRKKCTYVSLAIACVGEKGVRAITREIERTRVCTRKERKGDYTARGGGCSLRSSCCFIFGRGFSCIVERRVCLAE